MQLKQLFTDDDAVSPVIGVILMVAITVILAAVIGAFVLDIGNQQEQTPQASLTIESSNSSSVTISHDSGDSLSGEDVVLRGDGISSDKAVDLSPGEQTTITGLSLSKPTEVSVVHTPSGGVIASAELTS